MTLIVVSLYTYLTYALLRHAQASAEVERNRQRRSLATGLPAEMVLLEDKLRDLYTGPVTEYAASLRHPILTLAIQSVDLFEPETAFLLVRVHQDILRLEPIAERHWRLRLESSMPVSLENTDCNRVAFALSLMRDLQRHLRPLAPQFGLPWRTFPDDRHDRIPIGDSMFSDLPETLFGQEYPVATADAVIDRPHEDLGHR